MFNVLGRPKGLAALAAASTIAIVASISSAYAQEQQRQFNIPAQSLASALLEFSRQSDIAMAVDPTLVNGKRAPAVVGAFTPSEALNRLLAGSGLQATQRPGGGFALADASSPTQLDAADGAASSEEEIIVTAQKREERLQDVPQSISVVSSDTLENMGATQFRDFANTVPGLNFTTAGIGYTQISMRGVTVGHDIAPTTGIYVDEVPYGSSNAFADAARATLDVGLFDLDRIEVLRGPQGTLYGASTMGGLLKYVTRSPDPDGFGFDARAGISTTENGAENYTAAAALNAPLAGDAALRVGAFYSRDGGFIDNLALADDNANEGEVGGGRVDFLLQANEALSIRLVGFAQDVNRDGEATVDYSLAGDLLYGDLNQSRAVREPFEQSFRLFSATLDYDLGPATLTSISSYQEAEGGFTADATPAYAPLLALFFGRNYSAVGAPQTMETEKFTQEVRLASEAGGAIEWILGSFFTQEDSNTTQYFELYDLAGLPAVNDLYIYEAPSSYEEAAIFGDVTFHVTDELSLTGGLRYARNEQEFTQNGSGLLIGSFPTNTSSEDVVTYLANARYEFSQHTMAYARYATGYRPGGPNFRINDPLTGLPFGPPTFESDTLDSYEVGLRTETADRRFGVDGAIYFIDWSNIQIPVNRSGFGFLSNVPGGATVQGAELTLTARPFDGLRLTGAFAYQDATLSEADADLGAADGERLPNVPRLTASLSADYEFGESSLAPTIGGTVRYVSDREASFDASGGRPQYYLPEYTTVDLRASLSFGPITTIFNVNNLLDERGQLSANTLFGIARVGMVQPRTIGVTATARF